MRHNWWSPKSALFTFVFDTLVTCLSSSPPSSLRNSFSPNPMKQVDHISHTCLYPSVTCKRDLPFFSLQLFILKLTTKNSLLGDWRGINLLLMMSPTSGGIIFFPKTSSNQWYMGNRGSKHNVTLAQNRELFGYGEHNCTLQCPQNGRIYQRPFHQESYVNILTHM